MIRQLNKDEAKRQAAIANGRLWVREWPDRTILDEWATCANELLVAAVGAYKVGRIQGCQNYLLLARGAVSNAVLGTQHMLEEAGE